MGRAHLNVARLGIALSHVFFVSLALHPGIAQFRPVQETHPVQVPQRRKFLFEPGVTLNYEVHGEGGPVCVLLHGFGASLETWRDILPFITDHGTFYIVDLKGFGLSAKPHDKHYGIEDQAAIIQEFIGRTVKTPIVLVGHSYGGAVALMVHFNLRKSGEPERVRGLVLIDAAAYQQAPPFFVSLLQKPLLNRLMLATTPASLRARFTLAHLFHDKTKVDRSRVERYARYFDLPGAHYSFIQCAKQIVPPNAEEFVHQIPTISVPTLIIWGSHDPAIPVGNADRLHREIASSELKIIESGHVTHEERPAEAGGAIASFLDSLTL